jgi:hypothetical protein
MTEVTKPSRTELPGRSLDPFKWNSNDIEDHPHIHTLNRIASLSFGASTVLEIIEADELNDDDPSCFGGVLNANQKGALIRLVIETNSTIGNECFAAFDWAQKYGKPHKMGGAS